LDFIVLVSASIILYIYGGYYFILWLAGLFWCEHEVKRERCSLPEVTVLLTVFNEEKKIIARLKNIFDSSYPEHLLKVVVASDGSTDSTDGKVKSLSNPNICLVRPAVREGKTATQNYALQFVEGDIVIITDADTIFDSSCIVNLVAPFSDPKVGGVDGHLLFGVDTRSAVSESQGAYWKQELALRKLESCLGFLAVSSGPVLAIRRDLIPKMVDTVGEDCLLPLEVVSRGFLMKHQDTALAYDRMDDDVSQELRTRARMTQRNWQGTWMYPELLNPFKNFKVAVGLWSHKLLRWLSPIFLIMWVSASFFIVTQPSTENVWFIVLLLADLGVCFFILGLAGALLHLMGRRLVGISFVWAFWLANLGFLLGIWNAILGNKIKAYR
jgi:cellulose synthase/poly-beta-1,6-N-acetylglucosamine synthase-like glycosyltransferase